MVYGVLLASSFAVAFLLSTVFRLTDMDQWSIVHRLSYLPALLCSLLVLVPIAISTRHKEIIDLAGRASMGSLGVYIALALQRVPSSLHYPGGIPAESGYTLAPLLVAPFAAYYGIVLVLIAIPAWLLAQRLLQQGPAPVSGLFDYARIENEKRAEQVTSQGVGQGRGVL